MSSNGPVPLTALPLTSTWDAALTYDVLRPVSGKIPANVPEPVFVGREELLGPLVNAISEPDRRGTYLISGYRGAGKTSLVIEAGRRSMPRLQEQGLRLFPLVLNVSEISASLQEAGGTATPALFVDARRLLTALLRTLRNRLEKEKGTIDSSGQITRRVNEAYEKSQAAKFTRTAREQAEARSLRETSRRRSMEIANLLRLLAVLAAFAVVVLEGVFLVGRFMVALQAACIALAGVAVVSYQRSRTITKTETSQTTQESEYVFDNSLHQVETDLKDILDRLAEDKQVRTMFVLEELDKIEDKDGQQLDAVIRYFKNLFTQAPALFFFLTDKEYFDEVDKKIAAGRRDHTYAVAHTFFTNRVFVTRPSLDECLRYFSAVLTDEATRAAVEQIRDTVDVRLRVVEEMSLEERFLRVLLFRAQNHLFDLKNEMRGYVAVDQEGSRLVFDERTLTPQEQALAGLQFLVEQKAWLYRFRGGRDYANEILRNCLFAVCAEIDTDQSQPIEEILPKPSELGVQLRSAERLQIADAVESLIGDLSRGGAIDVDVPTQSATTGARSFRWRPKALTVFKPRPELETHEYDLQNQLERAIRVCAQFESGGPLAAMLPPSIDAGVTKAEFAESIEEIRRASRPLSAEDAAARSGLVVSQLALLVTTAHTAHVTRLNERGWVLSSISSDGAVHLVSPISGQATPQMVVAYGAEPEQLAAVNKVFDDGMTSVARAVVLVDDDPGRPGETPTATLATWRSALELPGRAPVLVTHVRLGEELSAQNAEAHWGDLTSDELWLVRAWTVQYIAPSDPVSVPPGPVWLGSSTGVEIRYQSLRDAVSAWLAQSDPLLGVPPPAGIDSLRVAQAFHEAARLQDQPQLLYEPSSSAVLQPAGEAERRLLERGRLIVQDVGGPIPPAAAARRCVITGWLTPPDFAARQLEGQALSTLRGNDEAFTRLGLADFVAGHSESQATQLYKSSAERGDPSAMGALLVRLARAGEADAVEQWEKRLIATADWAAVNAAASNAIGVDDVLAGRLFTASAAAGDRDSMSRLVALATLDDVTRTHWEEQLIARGAWVQLRQLGLELEGSDPARSTRLLTAAADGGDLDAIEELMVRYAQSDPERSKSYETILIDKQAWAYIQRAATRLRDEDPERAKELEGLVPPAPA